MNIIIIIYFNILLGWFLGVADTNDVIQKIEKTLNNTHTTTQKLTNNSFCNTKKHPLLASPLTGLFRNNETNNFKCRNITWLEYQLVEGEPVGY